MGTLDQRDSPAGIPLITSPKKKRRVMVMKIRGPLHSIDARGRFGVGFVLTAWRGLSVARIFTMPTNPRSARQLTIRGIMTAASRAWSALNDANRLSWTNYAGIQNRKNVFGQDIRASGFNEYCALYCLASDMGETPVSTAPSTSKPLLVEDGAIAAGAAAGEIDITWTAGQGGSVDIYKTGELPAGRAAKESDFTHDSYTADATAILTLTGLTTGAKYGIRIRQVFANGQVGPWTQSTLNAT